MKYYECPLCGASLDFGEVCGCEADGADEGRQEESE